MKLKDNTVNIKKVQGYDKKVCQNKKAPRKGTTAITTKLCFFFYCRPICSMDMKPFKWNHFSNLTFLKRRCHQNINFNYNLLVKLYVHLTNCMLFIYSLFTCERHQKALRLLLDIAILDVMSAVPADLQMSLRWHFSVPLHFSPSYLGRWEQKMEASTDSNKIRLEKKRDMITQK